MTVTENNDRLLQNGAEDIALVGYLEPKLCLKMAGKIAVIDHTVDCDTRNGLPAKVKYSIDYRQTLKNAWSKLLDVLTEKNISIPDIAREPINIGVNRDVCIQLTNDSLIVNCWIKEFDGSEEWVLESSTVDSNWRYELEVPEIAYKHYQLDVVCNQYATQISSLPTTNDMLITQWDKRVFIRDNRYIDNLASWKQHLASLKAAGTPLTVIYELAEPIIIPLDLTINFNLNQVEGLDKIVLYDINNEPMSDLHFWTSDDGVRHEDIRWNKLWVEKYKQFPTSLFTTLEGLKATIDYDMLYTYLLDEDNSPILKRIKSLENK